MTVRSGPYSPAGRARPNGFALIAVLWITACLATLAMGFAVSARLKGVVVLNNQKYVMQTQVLQSGLEIGYLNLFSYRQNKTAFQDEERRQQLQAEGMDFWYPRYEPYFLKIEDTALNINVLDLQGKIDIHAVKDDVFARILQACGVKDSPKRTAIINSVHDWIDSDEFRRIEGAENPYYTKLDPPYRCKNARMENIEELLLVKGIDQELYSGSQGRPGLIDFFNVLGENTKLEINCAAPETFSLLNDLPEEAIAGIIEKRTREPIGNLNLLTNVIPYGYFDALTRYFTTARSGLILIKSGLRLETGETGRQIQELHLLE